MVSRNMSMAVLSAVICLLLETRGLSDDSMGVFEMGTGGRAALSGQAVVEREGWRRIGEDESSSRFRGDVACSNGRVTVVLRKAGAGAELYAHGEDGAKLRAVLMPTVGEVPLLLVSVGVVENTSTEAAVDAVFGVSHGKEATVRLRLQLGQTFIKTEPIDGCVANDQVMQSNTQGNRISVGSPPIIGPARGNRGRVEALRVAAPCRFAVMPDFFADDIAVDATELPEGNVGLPGENFLLQMIGRGEAIVLAVWDQREEDVQVAVKGEGEKRTIRASTIPYGSKGSIYVAVLEGPSIWHWQDVAKGDADRIMRLDWKAPFAAQWRVDWRRDDGLVDSWEMLLQRPDGTYFKPDWFGQSANYGTDDWMDAERKRWTTVLGRFKYPCWIDEDCRGYLQPLKKPGNFEGPAVLYPLGRVASTPLRVLTIVDLMRATLGVGPCQYILDVEGQKKQSAGIPTCDARTKLNTIYTAKQQKERKAEVEQALVDALAFIRHIRERIEVYVKFGHETLAYLNEEKKAHPELADFVSEMAELAKRIDGAVAARRDGIATPEYATRLVEEFRATLIDYEEGDALEKCKKITAGFVKIGGNQDELVGECRMTVKILRQKAGLALAMDPQTAPVAKEIRRRTQEILRNPVSYEAPRH